MPLYLSFSFVEEKTIKIDCYHDVAFKTDRGKEWSRIERRALKFSTTLLTRGCRARNWCTYINDADSTYKDPSRPLRPESFVAGFDARGSEGENMPGLDVLLTRFSLFLFPPFSRLVKRWPSPRGDKPTGCVGRSIIIVIIFLSCLQHGLTFISSCHSVFIRFAVEIARISETFRTEFKAVRSIFVLKIS